MAEKTYKCKVPIFFTVDDNYINYMTITLESIVNNSKKSNRYDIYVIHTGLSKESRKKVYRITRNKDNFFIHFFNITFNSVLMSEITIPLQPIIGYFYQPYSHL